MLGHPSLCDRTWMNIEGGYLAGLLNYDMTERCPTFARVGIRSTTKPKVKLTVSLTNCDVGLYLPN